MNPPPNTPKLDNNALFAQRLIDTPPKYNVGDQVYYTFIKQRECPHIGYIACRSYNDREKNWKYAIKPYALNCIFDDVIVLDKCEV